MTPGGSKKNRIGDDNKLLIPTQFFQIYHEARIQILQHNHQKPNISSTTTQSIKYLYQTCMHTLSLPTFYDICEVDFDVVVSVLACVFMLEAQSMQNLMTDIANYA